MDSEFFKKGVGALTFLVMLNFRSKNFSEFFHLQSALDSELFSKRRSGQKLFLVMLNLRSKFFRNFLITGHSGLCTPQR